MLRECLEYLAIRPDGVYLDTTAGMGGHAGAIARQLSQGGLVVACDRDAESLARARANTADCGSRIHFHNVSFSLVGQALAAEGLTHVNGLLADLGVWEGQGFKTLFDLGLSDRDGAPFSNGLLANPYKRLLDFTAL